MQVCINCFILCYPDKTMFHFIRLVDHTLKYDAILWINDTSSVIATIRWL